MEVLINEASIIEYVLHKLSNIECNLIEFFLAKLIGRFLKYIGFEDCLEVRNGP